MKQRRKMQLISEMARSTVESDIHRVSRRILPHLAHCFLVSTFFEDGLRMIYQWDFQRDYIDRTWRCSHDLASVFVGVNLLTQLIGTFMIAVRYRIKVACALLGFSVVLQTLAYSIYKDGTHFVRFISLFGSLLLLYAGERSEVKSLFAGVPSLGDKELNRAYLQLTGRTLVALLFVTTLRRDSGMIHILMNAFSSVMMALIMIGYKSKLTALVLAVWLFAGNIYSHAFWMYPIDLYTRESLKYNFFLTMSVIGGLLLIVTEGPGDLSLDERKKQF